MSTGSEQIGRKANSYQPVYEGLNQKNIWRIDDYGGFFKPVASMDELWENTNTEAPKVNDELSESEIKRCESQESLGDEDEKNQFFKQLLDENNTNTKFSNGEEDYGESYDSNFNFEAMIGLGNGPHH